MLGFPELNSQDDCCDMQNRYGYNGDHLILFDKNRLPIARVVIIRVGHPRNEEMSDFNSIPLFIILSTHPHDVLSALIFP